MTRRSIPEKIGSRQLTAVQGVKLIVKMKCKEELYVWVEFWYFWLIIIAIVLMGTGILYPYCAAGICDSS